MATFLAVSPKPAKTSTKAVFLGTDGKMIKNSATHIAKNALAQDMLTPVRKTRVAACCAQRSLSSCTGKPPSPIRNLGSLMKPSQKRKVLCEPRGYVE